MGSRSLETVCEYTECDVLVKRYPSEIKLGKKKYCSQSCASKAYWVDPLKIEERKIRKVPSYTCMHCGNETQNWSKFCSECKRIKERMQARGMKDATLDEYYEFYKTQDGKCAICGSDRGSHKYSNLAIDHNHETGKMRGLLCLNCNRRLGWYEKYREEANRYLDN